jgi:hypothetical protein
MRAVLSPDGSTGRTRLLLGLVPVLGVLAAVPLWHLWRDAYWAVVGEDRLAEVLTFVAYLPAALLAFVVSRRLSRAGLRVESALLLLLGVGLLFIAGEEISWGQRQLGFRGPEALVERNLQGEANLHNLLGRYALHGAYIVVSAYGAFLGRVLIPRVPRLRSRPWLFVPQKDLMPWFGICLVYYVWADYLNPVLRRIFGESVALGRLTGPKLQESAELALAAGVLLFVGRLAVRRRPDLPADPGPEGPEAVLEQPRT